MLVHLPDGDKAEQVRDALATKIQTIPESDIDEARARSGIDRAACSWLCARVGFREGGSEGSHRCVVVANESEAP
jgi:hypothetical protein